MPRFRSRPTRTSFRTWDQIMMNEVEGNPFSGYGLILTEIGATAEDALQRMWELFQEAITNYTYSSINEIFISNYIANKKKYDQLVELYQENIYPFGDYYRNETYEHERTPNLTSTSSSTGSGTASTERKQSRTTTTTPNNYETETTHKVAPFDNNAAAAGLKYESQDTAIERGSTSTTESYTGLPDQTSTSSTASSSVATTGKDKNEYNKIIYGRDGRRPTSEVFDDGLKAAAMLDIMDIIINDIADQIFLQVWI